MIDTGNKKRIIRIGKFRIPPRRAQHLSDMKAGDGPTHPNRKYAPKPPEPVRLADVWPS